MTSAESVAAAIHSDLLRTIIDCADAGDDICTLIPGSAVLSKEGHYLTFTIDTYSIYSEKFSDLISSIDTTLCSVYRKEDDTDPGEEGLGVYRYTVKDFPVSCSILTRGDGGHLITEVLGRRLSTVLPQRIASAFRGSANAIAELSWV
ncbi:MAG: hypothetical protein IJV02_05355 [Candidatus Methanomethylophilaceae archaeon]|nr:hypothetical protein [Candidatus Methanomethylophilaceae archaeon]